MELLEDKGKTAMIVAINEQYSGIVAVADTVKETLKKAIHRLKKMGLEVVMMPGDNERTARSIAAEVGINTFIAEVLPEGKAAEMKKLQAQDRVVAMKAADITLMRGNLMSIAEAILMSKKTIRNIKQNLFWAFAYNTIDIPIAALGFLAPWLAGAAMAFSSVSVVLNA
ncbi:HAD family hydrolase [Metabacillus sediminilitoris]|uniref:P-type Cu(+) transporter n=1 Tax=Metabacillus sediminilitoris TaxID=2567941 RepID=A0A4S4C1T8_9BACI|nr:HAD-IC family P-type ATPase [Metabacillus sediminilitoris]THF80945.1 HAD family hydrolase [Metabacillus sediminilitoris]